MLSRIAGARTRGAMVYGPSYKTFNSVAAAGGRAACAFELRTVPMARALASAAAPPAAGGGSGDRAHPRHAWLWALGALATLGSTAGASWWRRPPSDEDREIEEGLRPAKRPELPTYSLADVAKHDTPEAGLWMTFRGAVYDMTGFENAHPGGTTRLLMAGGTDLEPFWRIYRQHFRGHVLKWMEKRRIGNLSPADAAKATNSFEFDNAYVDDPKRHPDLLGTTERPWCGEPRIELLTNSFYTPNHLFYVRNHLPVPVLTEEEYELEIEGHGIQGRVYKLDELKTKFRKYEVVSTLQCAGNRREDLHGDRGIFISPHWVVGAISNARWGGARLRDVLAASGMDVDAMALGRKDDPGARHVQFEGYDMDETGLTFGGSIPIDKAVDPLGDVLVAWEMNGEPLPRDHGFPVRIICPGHAGARQVKWLNKIIVSEKESGKPWHQKSYRGFAPDISFEDNLSQWPKGLRLDQAPIVQEMPVQSLVCEPPPNSVIGMKGVSDGVVTVKGVAWAGGGAGIFRVDVSVDGGKSFHAAELDHGPMPAQRRRGQWAWTQFTAKLPLDADTRAKLARGEKVNFDITSKGVDSSFNVQPETMAPYWNARGVVINHWYHATGVLDPSVEPAPSHNNRNPEFGNTPSGGTFAKAWKHHGWDNAGGAKKA